MPTTVSTLTMKSTLPARYMSWLSRACSITGPVVGRDSTWATITSPEIRAGSTQPTVEMNGLSATRSGYLITSRRSWAPRARAATT